MHSHGILTTEGTRAASKGLAGNSVSREREDLDHILPHTTQGSTDREHKVTKVDTFALVAARHHMYGKHMQFNPRTVEQLTWFKNRHVATYYVSRRRPRR